jgi:adenylate cyclase
VSRFRLPLIGRILLLVTLPLLWCWANRAGVLDFFENRLVDQRFQFRGEREAPVKLVYVDIDTDAIQQYKWPWNHARYAQILDVLFEVGRVKAVGIDLVFSDFGRPDFGLEEQEVGRRLFGRAVRTHGKVVLAANYVPGPGTLQPKREFPLIFDGFSDPATNDIPEGPGFPIVGPNWGTLGLIDTYRGETRAAAFFADTPAGTFYPISLHLALIHWGLGTDAIQRFPDRMEIRRPDESLVTSIPLLRGQLVEVNWFSPWISPLNLRASVADLGDYLTQLESDDPEKQARGREFFAQFEDAIVLIGPVDVLLQDLSRTSFDDGPVPQVGVHGNLLKTLVSGEYLRHLPPWAVDGVILALALATAGLAGQGGRRAIISKVAALLLLAAYVAAAFGLFSRFHLVLPLVAPVGAALSTSFASLLWQVVEEQRQKRRIKGMFGTYLSPQLVERMVESGEEPQLGGHESEITAYFSDIQAFSAFSERLPPARLVELMNEYLTACTDIVQEEGGTLDKYIGDAIVAMFGAPIALSDHAYRACVAAVRVQRKLDELRAKWHAEGEAWPEIVGQMRTRIGLNTGMAVIGNMGSRTRFSYTMMGDNVNLASRMESGAKSFGAFTMVTEATRRACEQHGGDRVVFRMLGRITVVGRQQPVPVHEILGLREDLPAETLACAEVFARAWERFAARDWAEARRLFQESARVEPRRPGETPGVRTNPSLVYLALIDDYERRPPPADWDGVYRLAEK